MVFVHTKLCYLFVHMKIIMIYVCYMCYLFVHMKIIMIYACYMYYLFAIPLFVVTMLTMP